MEFVENDLQFSQPVPQGQSPDYDSNNPIRRVVGFVEEFDGAADRDHYLPDSLQHLFPYHDLGLYGPADGASMDPREQDNKNDFQKQNIVTFKESDTRISRGYVSAGDWTGCFVKFSYRDSPFSTLWELRGGTPGPSLNLWARIGPNPLGAPVRVPYNPVSKRYEIEFWGFPGDVGALSALLGPKGNKALARGAIIPDAGLVPGVMQDFTGPGFDAARQANAMGLGLFNRSPNHAMHPVRPLAVEFAWASEDQQTWDSLGGTNYRYAFNMTFRGWNHYFQVGATKNPHGGVGFLEYRNLFSNYFSHEQNRSAAYGTDWENELGRSLNPWNFDAYTLRPTQPNAPKSGVEKRESFLAVEYMDLHIVQPDCGIGIHRHRDNQEIFMVLDGKALMIVGDWCEFSGRGRAFETRIMNPGDLTICKTGQLHALYNALDEPCSLFMFGGYD